VKMPTERPSRLRDAAMMLLGVLMLSAVAFYNRYPFIFADTGGYLVRHNRGIRSYFYALFVAPAHLTHTLWSVVIVNSILILWLLRLVLREVFAIRSRVEVLVIIAILCVTSSLPWFTAFVMPDIFTPMTVLGLFMIAFCLERLGRWEQRGVIALTFLAMIVHYTNVPIAFGLTLIWLLARTVMRERIDAPMPHLAIPAALMAAGVVAIVISNYLTLGIATYSPGGYAFLEARLIDHGPAVAYLRENCPTHHYAACDYLDRMPMKGEDFLWAPDGLFSKFGFIAPRKEGMEIVTRTVEEYPFWVARDAFYDAVEQLEHAQTGNGLRAAEINPTTEAIQSLYPGEFETYLNSRQGRGEFTHRRELWALHWNFLIICAFYSSFIAILLAFDRRWLPVELMITVGLTVLINAFATGPVSEPTNRYGSRIIWLVPLIALASWRHAIGLPSAEADIQGKL
jgi:hypothetical protein